MTTHNMFYGEIQILSANVLIYHHMPSLSASLDQIQKIRKIEYFIYLLIHLFIYCKIKALWHKWELWNNIVKCSYLL